ncbi:MAG: hypothetical protein II871_03245 [Clostridia bacterium]|nr:hypothetical protein [Clostridia bacterium]
MLNNAAHFLFDSEHLNAIEPRLYGFCVTSEGMFTGDCPSFDIQNATGAWVLVRRTPHGMEISQDSIGCFGLYLYQNGDYWALSNSFNKLLDYLKTDHKLSLNEGYAKAFLADGIGAYTYGETIIREIRLLDRRVTVLIEPDGSAPKLRMRSLNEGIIRVDSEAGLLILDAWHDKWASFIARAARTWPGILAADLSGGFDTRMVLAPILSACIGDRMSYRSNVEHEEDYRIASGIANEFGFALNEKPERNKHRRCPTVESRSERALETIFFEKIIYKSGGKKVVPCLQFCGFGGEAIRNYGIGKSCSTYSSWLIRRLPKELQSIKNAAAIDSIFKRSYNAIFAMLAQTEGKNSYRGWPSYYMETRARMHFGTRVAADCLSQNYYQAILFDPLLLKLRAPKEHPFLITALILTRYHKALAAFPFDHGRIIPEKSLRLAEQINELYPRAAAEKSAGGDLERPISWSLLQPQDEGSDDCLAPDERQSIADLVIAAYDSPRVQKLFGDQFGEAPALWTELTAKQIQPNRNRNAIAAIAKVICDIKMGKDAPKDISAFIAECLSEAPAAE